MPRQILRRAASLLTSLVLAADAQAGSIAINFSSGRTAGTGGSVNSGTAGVVPQSNWNNAGSNNGSLANLTDDSGANTGAAASWTSNNTWSINGSNYTSGNNALMNGYLDTTTNSTTTVTITGVPYGEYDVYLYFDGDGTNRAGIYTVDGDSRDPLRDVANWSFSAGTFSEAPSPNSTGNFSRWEAVSASTLVITARASAGGVRGPLNGLQIVGTSSPGAPEVETLTPLSLTSTAATLRAQLLDSGTSPPLVQIHWGTVDAATGPWQHVENLGTVNSPQVVSRPVSALTPNTEYFARAFSSNSQGEDWANTTISFVTPTALPSIANSSPTDVDAVSATLGATVEATGGDAPDLVLYYGTSDGGTSPSGWQSNTSLGTQSSSGSTQVTGLTHSTTYFFRVSASNAAGTSWAPFTSSFTTSLLTLPALETLAATNVAGISAKLNGRITSTGGDAPTVTFYYGTSDGGSDPSGWNDLVQIGTDSGNFSRTIGSLSPLTTYFFRAYAENAAGGAWASPSLQFTTTEFVPATIVINEIHYDEDNKTLKAEFIELYNNSDNPVDLSSWYFSDGIGFTFPEATSIPARGYLVIAQDPATVESLLGHAGALGPWTGKLSNDGETLTLRDVSGNVVDEVDYGLGFPWPTVGSAPSPSIELINPSLENDVGGNWRAAGNIPATSPGGGVTPAVYINRASSNWRFIPGNNIPASDATGKTWTEIGYDDSLWTSARTPIGYDDGDDNTVIAMEDNYITFFARHSFTIAAGQIPSSLDLELYYDDAVAIWINGTKVQVTDNALAGTIPDPPTDNLVANHEWNQNEPGGYELFQLAGTTYLVEGTNTIAVQHVNATLSSSDASMDVSLATGGATPGGYSPRDPSPGTANSVLASNSAPALRKVDHSPAQPASNTSVAVTVTATDNDGVASVSLDYQLVDPGDYINIDDPRFTSNWTTVQMQDDGTGGDLLAGDDVYTATLPPALQTHRRLVRYRITAVDSLGNTVTVPYLDDPQPNFAYFVYDGLPTWTASSSATTYDFNQLEPVPVYQLITTRQDHEESQSIPNSQVGSYGGSDYLWQGTLVYDGRVYDHIRFRARGGVWRYSMGKNMWKFDFNRGHRLQARDDYGKKYSTQWRKLNFSSLIQQGNFRQRGEQGLFEWAGFKLHNLLGNPAPNTSFAHFRIVEHASENGPTSSQYDTDFQGLYLAIEQLDGQFLDEHNLPDGNFYKMEGGSGELNNQGADQPSNKSDLNAFLTYKQGNKDAQWWRDNLVLDDYYSFRAVATAIHDYDIHANKNYFFYHRPIDPLDPNSNKWQAINWDLDLTWTTTYGGGGIRGPLSDFVLAVPELALEYRNRMRELLDLAFNTDQTGKILDECARIVHTPGEISFVDADRDMWDQNPILVSSYINSTKAGHNRYWEAASQRSFASMLQHVKNYITTQTNFIKGNASNLQNEAAIIPVKPTITYSGPGGFPADSLTFDSTAYSDPQGAGTFAAMQWRIGEIYNDDTVGYLAGTPFIYEVEPLYDSGSLASFQSSHPVPPAEVRPGHTYRARVRHQDTSGNWSHWSDPVEFVAGSPDVVPYQQSLVISEFMYHPPDATPGEIAAGFSNSDFEWMEIHNIGSQPVDLTGVRFTKGIDFDFADGTTLAPGAYALLASNQAAFELRHPSAPPIVGTFAPDKLSNGGENIKLSLGAGTAIHEFTYQDSYPWPSDADGAGFSLTLITTGTAEPITGIINHADPANWRLSRSAGGSPGTSDSESYANWKIANAIPSDDSDEDKDGLTAFMEFALGTNPSGHNPNPALPGSGLQEISVNSSPDDYLTVSFRRRIAADELTYTVQFSDSLTSGSWSDGENSTLVSSTANGDGTVTQLWRFSAPASGLPRQFTRLQVTN